MRCSTSRCPHHFGHVVYVHCTAHNLNLVLNDTCQDIAYQRQGTVDIATTQLKRRFTSMNEIANHCFCFNSQELLSTEDDNLFASANLLAVQYPDDLSPDHPIQLISFRNVLRPAIKENEQLN
jgi:hypothetical protein